jgi:hypothetical protein
MLHAELADALANSSTLQATALLLKMVSVTPFLL